jgi:CheY-like chemotaxis protein
MNEQRIIFYADDDADDIFFMQEAVDALPNHRLITASNGQEALYVLDKLAHSKIFPCVIILDVNMPVMDGIETMKRLKETNTWKDVPICLFTTSPLIRFNAAVENYKIQAFQKPVTMALLHDTIKDILQKCKISF